MITFLDKISNILFFIFLLIISIDPTGSILGIKEICFVFLMIVALIVNKREGYLINKNIIIILMACFSFPIYGILVAIIKNNFIDHEYAIGHMKSFFFILIFFFLKNMDIKKILKLLFINGSIIACFTIIIFFIAQINDTLFSSIYDSTLEYENIIISKRTYYNVEILGIYFKSGPLILFSLVYSLYFLKLQNKRFFFIGLNLFALLIAGSRTPSLISIFIIVTYLFDKYRNSKIVSFFIITIVYTSVFLLVIKLASETGEYSNQVKFGDFSAYLSDLSEGNNSIFGAGLGSMFWGEGKSQFLSNSEQTYMDFLRIYGLLAGSVLIFFVFYPFVFLYKSNYVNNLKYRRYIMTYALYMILAGTNPLLVSSTGMLVWAMGLTFIHKIDNQLL